MTSFRANTISSTTKVDNVLFVFSWVCNQSLGDCLIPQQFNYVETGDNITHMIFLIRDMPLNEANLHKKHTKNALHVPLSCKILGILKRL